MNAENFYAEFMAVLEQLGVDWEDKNKIEVSGKLLFTLTDGTKKTSITLAIKPTKKAKAIEAGSEEYFKQQEQEDIAWVAAERSLAARGIIQPSGDELQAEYNRLFNG